MNRRFLFILLGFLLLCAALAPSYYFFNKYNEAQKRLSSDPVFLEKETKYLVTKVGKLIDLPADELPTIATVTDVEKLSDQPFYAKAKNGDKILIYTKAKKAILYNPALNKVMEVGPLLFPTDTGAPVQNETAQPTQTILLSPTIQQNFLPTPSPLPQPSRTPLNVTVVLYNGTATPGLTGKSERSLTQYDASIRIVDKAKASKSDYVGTLVIDLKGTKSIEAQKIALILSARISEFPPEETRPENADILVIVGADKK